MNQKTLIKKWWFWAIALIVSGLAIAVMAPKSDEPDDGQSGGETSETASISEEKAELFCQDAGLIRKYLNSELVDIISTLNLNEQFGDFGGWRDSDGNKVFYVRWNGKNKLTDEDVRFDCWISGTNENIKLHRLAFGDEVLEDITPTTIYDENGDLIFGE